MPESGSRHTRKAPVRYGPASRALCVGNRQHVERGVRPLEHDVLNRRGGGIDHDRADRCRLPFAVEPDHLRDRRAQAQREPFVRRGQIDHDWQARVAHLREEQRRVLALLLEARGHRGDAEFRIDFLVDKS